MLLLKCFNFKFLLLKTFLQTLVSKLRCLLFQETVKGNIRFPNKDKNVRSIEYYINYNFKVACYAEVSMLWRRLCSVFF